jgi:biopolymer transport protein ExbD
MSDPNNPEMARTSDVKRIIRKRIRRQPEHEHQELNIYAMMDMMTILLVFLIQQFATTSANVNQSEELRIPTSVSQRAAEPAIVVTISRNDILVDGTRALSLRNGLVDPSQKNGGANAFLINPLLEPMQAKKELLKLIASRNPQRPFTGEVQIIADRRTPYRTLIEVVYTCGQAEFKNVRFVVVQQAQGHSAGIGGSVAEH